MPSETFNNLPEEKKKQITAALYREFALKNFDDASITSVVKQLGIAKGSIYQYFKNKQEAFLYLAAAAGKVKEQYVLNVKRENYADYWEYLVALYQAGMEFDKNHFLESHFLHSIEQSINSPSIKDLYDSWLKQTVDAFTTMIKHEVNLGLFRSDIAPEKLAFQMYKTLVGMNDYMKVVYGLNVEESINKGVPIYNNGYGIKLMQAVQDYISILKPAFNKQ